MTNYSKGRRFEWSMAKQLREKGAVVIRSAGSHGEADLVAFWPKEVWAVQCKTRKPTAHERNKIREASRGTDAIWILAWREERKTRYEFWIKGVPVPREGVIL